MKITTYLFDLDGTLADSIDLIIESYNHTMAAHRREPRSAGYWRALIGTPLVEQFKRLSDDPAEIEAMIQTYGDYNIAHHNARVRPYPGVLEAVDELRSDGVRLGVVSSKRRIGVFRFLDLVEVADWFDIVVGGDETSNGKPHPDPVLKALTALDAAADETVFVGDSPHDMAAGRAAGVHTAAALWGPFPRDELVPHKPTWWLQQPTDMIGLNGA